MKPSLVILIGLQGSGKSTVAEKIQSEYSGENGCKIISSDQCRKDWYGDENDQSHNSELFNRIHKVTKEALLSGTSVILDATNINMKSRRAVLECVRSVVCKKIAYVVCTPIDLCVERDKKRERSVGEKVIRKTCCRFQVPILLEGFDEIILSDKGYDFVSNDEDDVVGYSFGRRTSELGLGRFRGRGVELGRFPTRETLIEVMNEFEQNNPHHKWTVGVHSQKIADNYVVNSIRYEAALWHDVGKLFTETVDDDGVSHYLGHEGVGAYYIASHRYLIDEELRDDVECVIDILAYINYHMQFLNDTSDLSKFISRFGLYLTYSMKEFSQFDKQACN